MFSAGKTPYLSYRVEGLSPAEILDNIKIMLQIVHKLQSEQSLIIIKVSEQYLLKLHCWQN